MGRLPQEVVLRSGHPAWIRPVRAEDAAELQRAFTVLSDLSRYKRFLTGKSHLTDRQAAYFTAVDHHDHEALIALDDEHGTDIIGVARFIRHPQAPTDADLAITIADEWHDRGLATVLLRLLSQYARAVGVRRFQVDMLADNPAVLGLLRSAGLVDEVAGAGMTSGYVDLASGQ